MCEQILCAILELEKPFFEIQCWTSLIPRPMFLPIQTGLGTRPNAGHTLYKSVLFRMEHASQSSDARVALEKLSFIHGTEEW